MQRWNIHNWLLAALLMMPCISVAAEGTPSGPGKSVVTMPAELATAITEYRLKLKEDKRARQEYDDQAAAYWNSVAEKRRARNAKRGANEEIVLTDYVLTQPPVYTGPPEPVNPEKGVPEPPPPRKYIPVVADFLRAAKEQFDFTPQMPKREIEFKRAYAKVAAAAGLTKDQIVRIYGFESGGDGRYDVQAGLEYPKPDARAISTAVGYNQLLNTNSVDLLAEQGDNFVAALSSTLPILARL
jgi:hypothetical protein